MRRPLSVMTVIMLLSACGQGADQQETTASYDMTEAEPAAAPPPQRGAAGGDGAQGQPLEVTIPRIAYSYGYAFRLAADAVPRVQERHVELCQRLGPARCRIVELQRSQPSGAYLTASTKLQVAAPLARRFGEQLVATATEAGADNVERSISGEDLSRQMIDAEARIRTREVLIRRLTTLLETRSGNIQQAVEAERAISTAQEELDSARAWLAEMRTRVDMSTFTIRYESGAPLAGGVATPIREAWGEVGSVFARSVAALILLAGVLLPWLALGLALFYFVRWLRRRRRAREADETAIEPAIGAAPEA